MSLSPEQFAEHLAGLEAATGIQYHPGGMTLPSGLRVPAMHHKAMPNIGESVPSGENQWLKIRSVLPSETGALHSVIATQHDAVDNPGNFMLEHYSVPSILQASDEDLTSGLIDKGVHRSAGVSTSSGYSSPHRQWFPGDPQTVGDWGEHVERSLVESKPPSDEQRAHAADRLEKIAGRTQMGKIMPVGGTDFDFDLRSR